MVVHPCVCVSPLHSEISRAVLDFSTKSSAGYPVVLRSVRVGVDL